MKKSKILLILLVALATFFLVYAPHYNYPFPLHIDEWRHITEALKLRVGEYTGGSSGYRIGFHILLLLLSKITNLVSVYRFFPAVWTVFSSLVLFYVVYKKTEYQFYPAIFAMVFFASIKSNVNLTGLWFFTPLTFSIPFIFLYVYFFTEGFQKQNKKFILLSLAIMACLLFIHSISVLFAVPFLLIYALFHRGYLKKEWRLFSLFLIIPAIGILFFKFMAKVSWGSLIGALIHALQFKDGWRKQGYYEYDNSLFELYSLAGYILAIIGLWVVFRNKKNFKKYLAYALWPLTALISIIIYKITDFPFLSPYQRNLYYFAISLPLLSALGLNYLLRMLERLMNKATEKEFLKKASFGAVFMTIMIFSFVSYFDLPQEFGLYRIIGDNEYQALVFLSTLKEKSTVMAPLMASTALYAVSQQRPVASYLFFENRQAQEKFFLAKDCATKQGILNDYRAKYVLSESKINCGWKLIYDNKGYYIYQAD